mmetsp:Transcript_14916/g.38109  ORF Transcript_14916/g.38109 Transcript_14916/m.38109 type:complete len:245 (+) Transcript_14916:163-897(+)
MAPFFAAPTSSPFSFTIAVPALPASASPISSGVQITTLAPSLTPFPPRNASAASIFGAMLPAPNSPAASIFRASSAPTVSSHSSSAVPNPRATLRTAVQSTNASTRSSAARISEVRSLSTTAGTPRQTPDSSCTTGMPPPPPATTMKPASTRFAIASRSRISSGSGDATTLRQPFAAPFSSSLTTHSFPPSATCSAASSPVIHGPIGLSGLPNALSPASTRTRVTTVTTFLCSRSTRFSSANAI